MAWNKTRTTYSKIVRENDVSTKIVAGETDKFRPTVYMAKWSDEAWLKLTIPLNVTNEVESVNNDIISFTFANNTFRFYTKPDESLEYEIVLSKRPPGQSSWTFNIDFPSGIEFLYQRPLANTNPDGSTWEIDSAGGRCERPANVSGSYAVYYNKSWNQYKTGKFCHIFRPELTDADGIKTWAILSIDLINKTLTITVDSAWLKDARYPVVIDPTIGYETVGGSNAGYADFIMGTAYAAPASGGTLTSIHVACASAVQVWRALIYNNSDVLVDKTAEHDVLVAGVFESENVLLGGSITASATYKLGIWLKDTNYYYDDTGPSFLQSIAYSQAGNPPDPLVPSTWGDRRISIHADYEAGGNVELLLFETSGSGSLNGNSNPMSG